MKNCLLLRSNLQAYFLCFQWTASLYAILQNSCLKVCAYLHIPPFLTMKYECKLRHTWWNGNKCLLPLLSFKDNLSSKHSMLLYAHVFQAEPPFSLISNNHFPDVGADWFCFPLYLYISYAFFPFNGQPRPHRFFFFLFIPLMIHRWHQSQNPELA